MSQFGKLQIRPSKDICYSSSHADENFNPLQTDGDMYDENKRAAIEMTNVVRIGGDNIKAIFDRAKEEAMQVLMDVTCKVSKIIELRYTQRETLVNLNQKTSATDGGMVSIYDTINYDVSKCEIIFVPVCNLPRCYCYVFHFKKQQVQILDPLNSNSKGNASIVSYHSSVLPVIVKAMQQCMSLFFPDWSADMSKWECCIPDGYIPSITRGSGLYMLHCMKYWNGNSCIKSLAEDNLIEFRKEILFDILQIKPNFAKIPQAIEELLNQNPEIEIVQID